MDAAGGAPRGFDYLRILLAIAVVTWHSLEVSYGSPAPVIVWKMARPLISLILPMFFALSGFLVCGSLVRTRSIVVFMSHRFLRLIPALMVEILLSALILGPLLTRFPRSMYFEASAFRLYFLNVVGNIHFYLPGVFLGNPTPGIVNRSLWTIPYELECYLSLVVLSVVGLTRRRMALTCLLVAACVFFMITTNLHHSGVLTQIGPPGRLLVLSFFGGIVLYLWRDRAAASTGLFIAAAAASLALLAFPQTMFLAALPVAYMTTYLGLLNPPKIPVLMDGDYSYGLYLFAYPLQQTYALLFPTHRVWWLDLGFAVILGLLYAAFSWNVVEKRVLRQRKRLTLLIEQSVSALQARLPRSGRLKAASAASRG